MRSLQINVASTESSAARTRPRMYALFALVVQRLGGVSLFDKGAWDGLQTDIFMLLPERLLALHGNFTCLFPGLGQTSNV